MPDKKLAISTTPLNPSEQGLIARAVQGVRTTVGGVLDAWFGPLNPIQPIAPNEQKGRQFDYPVGYNLRITPRQDEPISFPQLRGLADAFDIVRLAIETRKDQMGKLGWAIQSKNKDVPTNDAAIDSLTEFFLYPDKKNSFHEWLRCLLEDMFVIDAPTIYPRMSKGGKLYSLELVDGATIKRVVDAYGHTPEPPDVAYQQILHGVPAFDYTSDELVYRPRNIRTHKVYGFSPLEQIVMMVNIALRRQIYLLNFYTEGNIPDAFIGVPDTWTPDNIRDFQKYWDGTVEGDLASRRKAKFVPGASAKTVHETRDPKLKDEFDEWIARVVCYAFSLPPTAFVRQMNRATGETTQEAALEEGLAPIMVWVKSLIDFIIVKYFGYKDLEFVWKEEQEVDQLKQAQINDIYIKNGVKTVETVREELGLTDQKGEVSPLAVMSSSEGQTESVDGGDNDTSATGEKKGLAKLAGFKKKKTITPIVRERPDVIKERTKYKKVVSKFFKTVKPVVSKQIITAYERIAKSETDSDVDDILAEIKFQGWDTLINPTKRVLKKIHSSGAAEALAQISFTDKEITDVLNEDALGFASERAAEMVGMKYVDGELVENPSPVYAITDGTREYLRNTVAKAIEEGWSTQRLADAIEENEAFGDARATNIARTEIGNADIQGSMAAYRASGIVSGKYWVLGSLHEGGKSKDGELEECEENAEAGVIDFDELFPSGHNAPLAHPQCVCDIIPVLLDDEENL